jgi:hypothetical protein
LFVRRLFDKGSGQPTGGRLSAERLKNKEFASYFGH